MDKQEISQWLGITSPFEPAQEILDSMADTPVPHDNESQLRAFQDFLKSGMMAPLVKRSERGA